MTFHTTRSWFLLQCKPNSAQIAKRNLERQGFKTFLPLEPVSKRVRGRYVDTTRLLFPGYMFVAVTAGGGHWRSIDGTYGVSKLVSFGNEPAVVPHDLITALQASCGSDGTLLPPETLRQGDLVGVQTGPFANLAAEVLSVTPDQRVWVLMDMLGGKTKVALHANQLRRTL